MLNEAELNQIKGLLHYLNAISEEDARAFDVNVIASNGECLGSLQYDGFAYMFHPGLKVS